MVIFWIISSLLFLFAIIAIVYPVLKDLTKLANQENELDQKAFNVEIAKEQIIKLDDSYNKNEISKEEYDDLKYEIESSLMDDLSNFDDKTSDNTSSQVTYSAIKPIIIGLALFIPAFSMAFYHYIGEPDAFNPEFGQHAQMPQSGSATQTNINQMLTGLVNKLKENPQDIDSWFLLARSFMSLERYTDAATVYNKMLKMTDNSPDVLVSLADALAMSQGGKMQGEPEQYIQQALAKDPNHVTALWLAGIAAREKNDTQLALKYFDQVLPLLEDDEQSAQAVKKLIAQLGGKVENTIKGAENVKDVENVSDVQNETTVGTNLTEVTLEINLSAELAQKITPEMTVFVYAKAFQGPPMPLAAAKYTANDLLSGKISVTLNDQMAMMPSMKLSSFDKVNVGARISKSGSPMKRTGDFTSKEVPVDSSSSMPVELIIDSLVP
ncbi:MAG: c-type cytochrome biogenesis protein CcmI [Gammaproteobacteria bacterium]|nr:c-type cytochrome biogenesis protein CcmI [Gammaproteobacteria bacterium]